MSVGDGQRRPAAGLAERLRSRAFTVTSELVPPRGADADAVRRGVAELDFADALNLPDLPRARTRMSALAAAALVVQAGGHPILQMTCRDRNALALAADAIGAAAVGVEAVLPLWGDPIAEGANATEVRDVDTPGFVALLRGLAEGRSPDGQEVVPPPRLLVGAAAAPGQPAEAVLAKLEAGAGFFQTQIVLDPEGFAAWLEPLRAAGLTERAALLPGVAVPTSLEMVERFARFGAHVAPGVAARVERGEGEAVAHEIVEALVGLDGVAGVHLMPLDAGPAAMRRLAEHARRLAATRASAA